MSRLSVAAVLVLLVAAPFVGCHRRQAEAPPPPPPAPTMVTPAPCGPLGTWKVPGPGGETQVEVTPGDTPDQFVVKQKGASNGVGVGVFSAGELKVNVGSATGGAYSCKVSDDCQTLSCGFPGQTGITVLHK